MNARTAIGESFHPGGFGLASFARSVSSSSRYTTSDGGRWAPFAWASDLCSLLASSACSDGEASDFFFVATGSSFLFADATNPNQTSPLAVAMARSAMLAPFPLEASRRASRTWSSRHETRIDAHSSRAPPAPAAARTQGSDRPNGASPAALGARVRDLDREREELAAVSVVGADLPRLDDIHPGVKTERPVGEPAFNARERL